jgi:APA family basic amino acid/polyamine antiporter
MASVFVAYLSRVVDVPRVPVTVALFTVFFVINLIGVGAAGKVARVLVLLKLVALIGFIVIGLPHVEAAHFVPVVPNGWLSILAAMPLLVGLYTGIESAAEAGEEIRDGRAAIGKGLAIATAIGMLLYLGTSVVSIGILGPADVAGSAAPLSLAAERGLGSWMSPVLLFTALISIGAAIGTLMLIFSRFLFAMGRDGVLPSALARVHPSWGTPHVSLIVVYIAALASLLLPESLVFLFLASNLPTMFKYGSNCLAAARLVDRHPELHAKAAFRMQRRTVKLWSYLGMACAAIIILAGLGADARPYLVLGGWVAAGTLYWWVRGRQRVPTAG